MTLSLNSVESDKSAIKMEEKDNKLQAISIDNNDIAHGEHVGLELFSYFNLFIALFLLIVFEVGIIIPGIQHPNSIIKNELYYPILNNDNSNLKTIEVEISPVSPTHRFLLLNFSLVRAISSTAARINVGIGGSIKFLNDGDLIDEIPPLMSKKTVNFDPLSSLSSFIPVVDHDLYGCNKIFINLTLKVSLINIKGIQFNYIHANPSMQIIGGFISILIFVCSLVSVIRSFRSIYMLFSKNVYNMSCFMVSIFLLVSSFPYDMFFSNSSMIENISFCIYTAIFRFLSVYILCMIIKDYGKLTASFLIAIIVFVLAYSVVEMLSLFSSTKMTMISISKPFSKYDSVDVILFFFHIFYSFCVPVMILWAVLSSRLVSNEDLYKSMTYGSFIFLTILSTIISRFVLENMEEYTNSVIPTLLYKTTHWIVGISFIFLQNYNIDGYESIISYEISIPDEDNELLKNV